MITLSEVSQTNIISLIHLYVESNKNDTKELQRQKWTQDFKANLMVMIGETIGEKNWEGGNNICVLLYKTDD